MTQYEHWMIFVVPIITLVYVLNILALNSWVKKWKVPCDGSIDHFLVGLCWLASPAFLAIYSPLWLVCKIGKLISGREEATDCFRKDLYGRMEKEGIGRGER